MASWRSPLEIGVAGGDGAGADGFGLDFWARKIGPAVPAVDSMDGSNLRWRED